MRKIYSSVVERKSSYLKVKIALEVVTHEAVGIKALLSSKWSLDSIQSWLLADMDLSTGSNTAVTAGWAIEVLSSPKCGERGVISIG